MKDLSTVDDRLLLAARNTFQVIKEMLSAQGLPTSDSEDTLAEVEAEIDRIDCEILARGLHDMDED